MTTEQIAAVLNRHKTHRGALISILEDIQAKHGFLPEDALRAVAKETGRSLVEIYGVATFYRGFSLKPRGKHIVSACLGTACHVRGAPSVVTELENQLRVKSGETTVDKEFTLETVNCLGACALGPIVVIDGRYFSNVSPAKVKKILEDASKGFDRVEKGADERVFPVVVRCPRCNHSLMDLKHKIDDHPSIRVTVSGGQQHGWLRLSSLYGSYNLESEFEVPLDAVLNFFCPHCHAELVGASNCVLCEAPMIPMIVRGGGIVQICSRHGCKGHMLDINGVNA
ncbi:MAG: NADH-quinone oxidoreductase subunit NuoE [Planctomycetota bacterium]|nr:NADH-quinone oxidoreductase subunit NuoE [Planctomycetota bacterium]